jgi:CYTH domain-containing protein
MALEIERKFLTCGNGWRSGDGVLICQGYLCREPSRTVRVRLAGEKGWITIKGITTGAMRSEFEYEIPAEDARSLLALCEAPLLEKRRRRIKHGEHWWDVDEFLGDNAGLVVAEVELAAEDEPFERPPWLGAEVTADARYFNSRLALSPYRTWPEAAQGKAASI